MKKLSRIFSCIALFVLIVATPLMVAGCGGDGKETYSVALSTNNSNYGQVYGDGSYTKDEYVVIAASPREGYEFEKWVDSEESVISTDAITKIKVEYEHQSYKAYFKAKLTQKYAVVESVHLSLNGMNSPMKNWGDQVTSISALDWYVKINGYQYGSAGHEEVIFQDNQEYILGGTRRSFKSYNGVYTIDNKYNTNVNVRDTIQVYAQLRINGSAHQMVQLTQVDAGIVFKEDSNQLEVRYEYPGYGQMVVTFIYFVSNC